MVAIIYLSEVIRVFTSFPKICIFLPPRFPLYMFVSFRLDSSLKPSWVLGWLFLFYDWDSAKPMGSSYGSCPLRGSWLAHFPGISVSCGCCNKSPHTSWLETTGVWFLPALEAGCPKSAQYPGIKSWCLQSPIFKKICIPVSNRDSSSVMS